MRVLLTLVIHSLGISKNRKIFIEEDNQNNDYSIIFFATLIGFFCVSVGVLLLTHKNFKPVFKINLDFKKSSSMCIGL